MDTTPFDIDSLQRAILEANDVLPNPGSHNWYIFEKFRLDFVSLVRDFYCQDRGISPDQFPYRVDAVLALLAGYWSSADTDKIRVRHRLDLRVPPVVGLDPSHVLEFGETDLNSDTVITSHDAIEGYPKRGQLGNQGQDLTDSSDSETDEDD